MRRGKSVRDHLCPQKLFGTHLSMVGAVAKRQCDVLLTLGKFASEVTLDTDGCEAMLQIIIHDVPSEMPFEVGHHTSTATVRLNASKFVGPKEHRVHHRWFM